MGLIGHLLNKAEQLTPVQLPRHSIDTLSPFDCAVGDFITGNNSIKNPQMSLSRLSAVAAINRFQLNLIHLEDKARWNSIKCGKSSEVFKRIPYTYSSNIHNPKVFLRNIKPHL